MYSASVFGGEGVAGLKNRAIVLLSKKTVLLLFVFIAFSFFSFSLWVGWGRGLRTDRVPALYYRPLIIII